MGGRCGCGTPGSGGGMSGEGGEGGRGGSGGGAGSPAARVAPTRGIGRSGWRWSMVLVAGLWRSSLRKHCDKPRDASVKTRLTGRRWTCSQPAQARKGRTSSRGDSATCAIAHSFACRDGGHVASPGTDRPRSAVRPSRRLVRLRDAGAMPAFARLIRGPGIGLALAGFAAVVACPFHLAFAVGVGAGMVDLHRHLVHAWQGGRRQHADNGAGEVR